MAQRASHADFQFPCRDFAKDECRRIITTDDAESCANDSGTLDRQNPAASGDGLAEKAEAFRDGGSTIYR